MIEVKRLSKVYGTRRAVDDLSFSVGRGEILGFLGPNGAGKTTTMKILTCFMPATSGEAKVAGFDVVTQPLEVKRRVGYLPENPPVYREMLVGDYVEYAARLHGVAKGQSKKAAEVAIEKCGLGGVRRRMIGNLSKGYRQRVGLAQAIAHNPDVLILDEPTVGLDPIQILEIRQLIKSLAGDHTVVLSTHILPEVEATCSRVLILNEGKIVAIDTLDTISARMKHGNAIAVVVQKTSPEVQAALKKIQGVQTVSDAGPADGGTKFLLTMSVDSGSRDTRSEIAAAVVQSGAGLLELRRDTLSLEDIFLKLTTHERSL